MKRKGGDKEIVVWFDVEVELFLKRAPPHLVTPVLSPSTRASAGRTWSR